MAAIQFSNLSGDLRLAQMITAEINLLLRDTTNLRNSPYMKYLGSINGLGSDTLRVRKAGLMGFDKMETPASEIANASVQALTDSHVDITVARLALRYDISDLASLTGMGPMDVDPFTLAQSIAQSYEASFADKTAATFAGFSNSVGANATNFDLNRFLNAMFQLEKASNGSIATGAPGDLRSETSNMIAFNPANFDMLKAKGDKYAGNLFGVDVYRSAYVVANGSSGYDNAMFAAGALGYADGVPNIVGAAEVMDMGKIQVEFKREAIAATTRVVGHAYLGIGELDDARGVLILSAQ
jgi:hypothetical protein